HVDPAFRRIEVRVMRAFAGHECVEAGCDRICDAAAAATGDDTDASDALRAAGDQVHAGAEQIIQARGEGLAGDLAFAPDADVHSLVRAERSAHVDADLAGQDVVVANFWVHVEGEVRGVQGDAVLDQGPEPAIPPARHRA